MSWLKQAIQPYSLRARFFAVTFLVQVLLLGVLTTNGGRLIHSAIETQIEHRVDDIGRLLSSALAVPMMQRDLASVRDDVAEMAKDDGLVYLIVHDRNGSEIARFDRRTDKQPMMDGTADIQLADERLGRIVFGLSTREAAVARNQALLQSGLLALLAILASGLLLMVAGKWLGRRLAVLREVSDRVAAGDFQMRVPSKGEPEIDSVAQTFNRMSAAVQEQMRQLQESQQRFAAIADYTYDLEFWLSPEGKLLWVNPSIQRMFGYSAEECLTAAGFPLLMVHETDRPVAEEKLRTALSGGRDSGYVFRAQHRNGSTFWAVANWLPIHNAQGENIGLRASVHNIDALKQTEEKLRNTVLDLRLSENLQARYLDDSEQERARLVALLAAMNLGILFVGADGRVIYHNPAFVRMWGIDERLDLIGMQVADVLAKSSNQLSRPDHFSRHLLSVMETREMSDGFEIQLADGRTITELDYPVRDKDGRFAGHLWVYEDVTHERQTAEQLIYLAERDPLTGLCNRHRFQAELARVISESDRHKAHCAVMFFDLDEFKEINDNFGHRAGDALLMRVASEVVSLVRDTEIFSRLGGDEFAILLPNADAGQAEALAERVVRAIGQIPLRYEGRNLRVTASLGIAYYPSQSTNAEDLVAKADTAMYQAKQAGKNTWRVFREDSQSARVTMERLTWNERISRALEQNLLRLHFQGVYHAKDKKLSHYEALVRMVDEREPENLIMPAGFISIAEKSGRIIEIDRWVIAEVIRTLAAHPEMPGLAVNISARSFAEPGLPQFISEQLQLHQVLPWRLMVELTETAAVSDLQDAQRLIEALRQLGCGVCLDDFGTGFSSFAYLKHLHADTIKIDGMFIRDLHLDRDNQVFVKAIVDIAQGMGKTVVAEYVENHKVLEMLNHLGVDLVQGYLLDIPGTLPKRGV